MSMPLIDAQLVKYFYWSIHTLQLRWSLLCNIANHENDHCQVSYDMENLQNNLLLLQLIKLQDTQNQQNNH